MALSEDSPLGKIALKMAQKFVHCLEELSIHKGELKELEELIKRCNINISYLQKQAARVYNNHVESLRGAGDCKKNAEKAR